MNLNDITNKISDKDINELAKTLDYNSTTNFQKAYDKFKQAETLSDWLGSGYYDLVNTAENFISMLAKITNINIEQDIVAAKKYLIEKAKFKDSYIIAVTDFKRGNQNNFIMGADLNKRKLSLYGNEELLFKAEEEVLDFIPQIIAEHYKVNANNILGNVMYYEAHLPFGKFKFNIKVYMLKRIDLEIMNHLNIMATMPDIANQIQYYNKHNEVLVTTAYRPEYSKSENETRNKLLYRTFLNPNLEIYKFSYNQRKAFFEDVDFEDIELLVIVDLNNIGVLSEKLSLAKTKLDLHIEDFYRESSDLTILPKYQQIRFVSRNIFE